MDIHQATRAYEAWLRHHTILVPRDLRLKHERMNESPFLFLRATFYRWVQLWPTICPELTDAPGVRAVGDLHVENFGTWRDVEGRLIWGINDVDEACEQPFTQDLVRLATSALLAIRARHFTLSSRRAAEAIHDGYTASLQRGGRPIVLAEHHRWLRRLALNELRDPAIFWAKLTAFRAASGRVPHDALRALLPDPTMRYRVVHRVAGLGSLGRPRFVALGEWGGGLIAREAKALLPSAAVWNAGEASGQIYGGVLLERAVRVPDPFFAIRDRWIVRRLAPDCTRIELDELPRKRDEQKLLRAMGFETANVHLGTRGAPITADLRRRKGRWLERGALAMADAITEEWRAWMHRRQRVAS